MSESNDVDQVEDQVESVDEATPEDAPADETTDVTVEDETDEVADEVADEDADVADESDAEETPDENDPLEAFRRELWAKPGDWFVVHTYSGMENRVKSNLENRIISLLSLIHI